MTGVHMKGLYSTLYASHTVSLVQICTAQWED